MDTTIHIGDLVYLDTLGAGLVPAKVIGLALTGKPSFIRGFQGGEVTVKVTADRFYYGRGDIKAVPTHGVIPRRHVRMRAGQHRIFGTWTFA